MIPEFVGRLPVVATLDELDVPALIRILTEPRNALVKQYQKIFEFEGANLRFTDDALEAVAQQAIERKIGARGLRMILEELMLDMMFMLPSQTERQGGRGHAGRGAQQEQPADRHGEGRLGIRRPRPPRPFVTSAIQEEVHARTPQAFRRHRHHPAHGPAAGHRGVSRTRWCRSSSAAAPRCSRSSARSAGDKQLFLSTQRNAKVDNPSADEINSVGTVATIVQHLKLPNGNVKLLVEGDAARARPRDRRGPRGLLPRRPEGDRAPGGGRRPRSRSTMNRVSALFERFIKYSPGLPYETMLSTVQISDPGRLADTIAAHLPVGDRGEAGAARDGRRPATASTEVARLLEAEIEKLRVDKKINNRVKKQMEKAQKEYYLNEKIKAIQQELGRKDERVNEIEEFRQKIEAGRRCPTRRRRRPSRSSSASRSCRRSRPRRPCRATTSSGSSPCRGPRSRAS